MFWQPGFVFGKLHKQRLTSQPASLCFAHGYKLN